MKSIGKGLFTEIFGGGNWVIVKDLMNKYEHLLFIVVEYEK